MTALDATLLGILTGALAFVLSLAVLVYRGTWGNADWREGRAWQQEERKR